MRPKPSLGVTVAALIESVVEQPWFALVAMPIGYLAGLALAFWVLFTLGV